MTFIEVLCEGSSDVPAIGEILRRRFELSAETHFRIHAHRGKGKLPKNVKKRPLAKHDGLLDLLPAKLRAYGRAESEQYKILVVVLVDADDDDCRELKRSLREMYAALEHKPQDVLFRIAVEETESWFLADPKAVRAAFPGADVAALRRIAPDTVCGAWERLARALGEDPHQCSGADKARWAGAIAQHLELTAPKSPSLRALVDGLEQRLRRPMTVGPSQ
ncbi:MAG TPA: DUF4276 family protein [Polyangiaceae bacterium]